MRSLVALLLLVACSSEKQPDYVPAKAQSLNMSGAAEDVKLPSELFDELMEVYRPTLEDQEATDQSSDSRAKLKIPTEFFAFNLFLTEKTKGVLGGDNSELAYGKGGGVLDLKDFIHLQKGTFLLGFKPLLPDIGEEKLKVLFLSNSYRRESEGTVYGAGCNVYLNVSDFFNKSMATTGIVVNVAKERHVGLLGGTLFFAISIKGKLYLSQLTIRDSRYKNLFCRQ